MCTNRSLHRPQHSEGHHSFFFLDMIFSLSPHYWHYILQSPAGCSRPMEVFCRFLPFFWERNKMHNLSRNSVGRLGECTCIIKRTGHTLMIWSSVWGRDSFHQFYTFSCSCTLLVDSILVDLWPEQAAHFLWHMNTSPSSDFDLQHVSPHPGQAKPKLFTLSHYKWESAKCAELFSCPTVNREQRLRAWKEAEEKKMDQSDWEPRFELDDRICSWRSLQAFQIPQNIWMLFFQRKLTGV